MSNHNEKPRDFPDDVLTSIEILPESLLSEIFEDALMTKGIFAIEVVDSFPEEELGDILMQHVFDDFCSLIRNRAAKLDMGGSGHGSE